MNTTAGLVETLVRNAYEEGVEDGSEWATDRIMEPKPEWIDSVARVELLKATRTPEASDTLKMVVEAWQPIETAPRDGTEFDLFGFPLEASTKAVRMVNCHWHCGEWLRWNTPSDDEPGWAEIYLPTHWRPLPDPPAALAKAGAA